MKLFKVELQFKHRRAGRTGLEAIVHARSHVAAAKFLAGKHVGSKVENVIDLGTALKHFVIADLVL